MDRKNNRFLSLVVSCSAAGIIFGGTAGHAEVEQCQRMDTPSNTCLIQNPTLKIVEGMSMGLMAGAGAAIAAAWQLSQPKNR